jgi:hypothetical protein
MFNVQGSMFKVRCCHALLPIVGHPESFSGLSQNNFLPEGRVTQAPILILTTDEHG